MNKNVLRNLSYGVYVISTLNDTKPTGCIVNSAMQITYDTIAISVNHDNFTNECIKKCNKFAISILGENCDENIIPIFGFQCGRDIEKFKNIPSINIDGLNIIKNATGYITCNVIKTLETETHTIFLGQIKNGDVLSEDIPMTYSYYHKVKKGTSPKNAPTFIEETSTPIELAYKCTICGYIYKGDLSKEPEDFVCPICKQPKSVFEKI